MYIVLLPSMSIIITTTLGGLLIKYLFEEGLLRLGIVLSITSLLILFTYYFGFLSLKEKVYLRNMINMLKGNYKHYKYVEKIRRKIRGKIVESLRDKKIYPFMYYSYWHRIMYKKKYSKKSINSLYLTAIPNPGAGIGHQIANWIAGYCWAKELNLNFAHSHFESENWERFLGFGQGEIDVKKLLMEGYKIRKIPLFDENNTKELLIINNIINSYKGTKTIIQLEQDQFYKNQYNAIKDLQKKFYENSNEHEKKIIYKKENYNVGVHIRRGDIINDKISNPNLEMRYQSNKYFFEVLSSTINDIIKTQKKISIYIYSQGEEKDFEEFKAFPQINLCLNMDVQQTFLNMVYADLLITSKSSFSYKPALLNKGIKVCPKDFWHGYPKAEDWILVNEKLEFSYSKNENINEKHI